jgi:hypothetical protein
MQTRAIVDFGELSLNRAMRVYGPIGDLSFFQGRYYPSKAPFLAFAATPIYAGLKALCGGQIGSVPEIPLVYFSRLFLTILPTLVSLLFIRRFLAASVPLMIADAVTVAYALGTLAFSYSLLFMSHQTTASLLFLGFYAGWSVSRDSLSAPWLALSGFLVGLAVMAEYTSALAALGISAFAVVAAKTEWRGRLCALAFFVAGALPPALALFAYHSACFGGPLETGYRHLADLAYQPWHLRGFLGITRPQLDAFVGSFFSPLRGLFALSPVLLLGFLGLRTLWRESTSKTELRPLAVFTIGLTAAYVYFTSSFSYASWGWTSGPRHLTGLIPFLLLPAALVIVRAKGVQTRGICAGLVLASMAVTTLVTAVNYIPDDVSDAVFGLFVPLAQSGAVLPVLPALFGWPNPTPGVLVLLLVAVVGAIVGSALLNPTRGMAVLAAAGVLVAVLGIHRLAFTNSPNDRAAAALLQRVWLTPAGVRVDFWSNDGRSAR